ncbi:hypothetical protein D6C83_08096, partial [Aureobasidium pullulans]
MAAHNVAPLPPTPADLPHALSRISRPAKNWLINNLIRVWNFASPTLTSQPPANTRQQGDILGNPAAVPILGNPAAVPILGNPPAATILPQFK